MEWYKTLEVKALTFEQVHNKPGTGSTNIRIHQLIKYWPEFSLYRYGQNPDVLIFQKVYILSDYKFPKHFENLKILDICDPDWLEGHAIVETVQAMDAITCPTEALAEFIRQFTANPVVVIPDRFDLEVLPKPKKHEGVAKTVVWFGYSHNVGCLKPALGILDSLGLRLLIISNDDPNITRWRSVNMRDQYQFIKYDEKTIYDDLQKADFCLLPDNFRPQDRFKSNNKTVKAILAGLPVAKTSEEVKLYMDSAEREAFLINNYDTISKEYDVKKSIEQYKELIGTL